jgi:hypothetical protein
MDGLHMNLHEFNPNDQYIYQICVHHNDYEFGAYLAY